ncbi:MAG: hypothetical protein D3908_03455 [Candidatus Electrothrix sp. AUS4]|nr:hypothetical protein [Candidatus Electrothrix sp. AUS4]
MNRAGSRLRLFFVQRDIHDDKPGSLCSDKKVLIRSRAGNSGQLLSGIMITLSLGTRHKDNIHLNTDQ